MKKQIMVMAFTVLFSVMLIACGGKKTVETEIPVEEAIEIVEVKTCCKLDSTATCTDTSCDTTVTCEKNEGTCVEKKECNGSSNCASKK